MGIAKTWNDIHIKMQKELVRNERQQKEKELELVRYSEIKQKQMLEQLKDQAERLEKQRLLLSKRKKLADHADEEEFENQWPTIYTMQTDIITCLIAYLSMSPCSHRLTFEPRCRSTFEPKLWRFIFDTPVYIRLSVEVLDLICLR